MFTTTYSRRPIVTSGQLYFKSPSVTYHHHHLFSYTVVLIQNLFIKRFHDFLSHRSWSFPRCYRLPTKQFLILNMSMEMISVLAESKQNEIGQTTAYILSFLMHLWCAEQKVTYTPCRMLLKAVRRVLLTDNECEVTVLM